jgi:hypothetical protein
MNAVRTSCLLACALATTPSAETALEPAYQRLPLGEIQPAGWILAQMDNDLKHGVVGNFQKFRPAYSSGTWVKKDGDAGKAEMTGHWLDGFLRIPAWAGQVKLTAGGAKITGAPGQRIVEKEWRDGDTVTLELENPVGTRTSLNGERTLHRGPLLYVLPLAAETNVLTKSRIGGKEFEEWELRPADPDSLAECFLNAARPDAGFRAVDNPQHDPAMPWAEPPLLLTGELYSAADGTGSRESVTLRPMGSTLLRRAAFPVAQPRKNP